MQTSSTLPVPHYFKALSVCHAKHNTTLSKINLLALYFSFLFFSTGNVSTSAASSLFRRKRAIYFFTSAWEIVCSAQIKIQTKLAQLKKRDRIHYRSKQTSSFPSSVGRHTRDQFFARAPLLRIFFQRTNVSSHEKYIYTHTETCAAAKS